MGNNLGETVTIHCDSMATFLRLANSCNFLDDNFLYFYDGAVDKLIKCISFENGESNISNGLIDYLQLVKVNKKANTLIFDSNLFFPDTVKDLKQNIKGCNFGAILRNSENRAKTIKHAIIAKHGVYLTI